MKLSERPPGNVCIILLCSLAGIFSLSSTLLAQAPSQSHWLRQFGQGELDRAVYSPSGLFVLTYGRLGAVLWSVADRQPLRTFAGHLKPVTAAAFSADGTRLLTGSGDATTILWSVTDGTRLRTFVGHVGEIWSAAFSPDGQLIATGSDDGTNILWSARTGTALQLFGHPGPVTSVAFSPDGTQVVTGCEYFDLNDIPVGDITVWSWSKGFPRQDQLIHHTAPITSVAFAPDGAEVVSGDLDSTAISWSVADGTLQQTFVGHLGAVYSVTYSPDVSGTFVLTGSKDGTAMLWNRTSGAVERTFTGHSDLVRSAVFSPDGNRVLTASLDQTAKLWNTANESEAPLTIQGHVSTILSVAFSPEGTQLLTGCSDYTAKLWRVADGALLRTFVGHNNLVRSVAFSASGAQVLTGSDDTTVKIWDIDNGEAPVRTFTGHAAPVLSVAFSPNGVQILTGSADTTAQLWSIVDGTLGPTYPHLGAVSSVGFSANGSQVLTGSSDGTVSIWPSGGGAAETVFSHPAGVTSAVFSSDAAHVLTGATDGSARLWSVTAPGALVRTYSGHLESVTSVALAPNSGAKILTASADGTVKIWTTETGALELTFAGHRDSVNSAVYSSDGQSVLSGGSDGAVLLWQPLKASPNLSWNTPADLPSGTPLTVRQLNATAAVPGTFSYTPALNTVFPDGAWQKLMVTFTPADTASYTSASALVFLHVGADSDGDGMTDAQEARAGTASNDSSQALSATVTEVNAAQGVIEFPAVAGKFYRVERNDKFPSGNWTPVLNAEDIDGNLGPIIRVTDVEAPALSQAVYRVVVLP